jgi:VWFA-related protein
VNVAAILALCLICAAPAAGRQDSQAAPRPADSEDHVIRVASQSVLVDALVENKKTGNLIGNLGAADFVIEEDGQRQRIIYFSQDRLPLSVVFLFDLTETVHPILKPLARGALEILGHLKPQDQVAVMVFSSHTRLLQDFTLDHSLAATAIDRASEMKTGEGTFIYEDMYEAVGQALKSSLPNSRRVLVWFTDGTANFENSLTQRTIGKEAPARLHTKKEATVRLLRSDAVVAALIDHSAETDAVIAAMDVDPLTLMFAGARTGDISRYAEITGGPVLRTTKKEAKVRLAQLIDELRARYTIGYEPSAPKPRGSFCKIRVTLSPDLFKERAELKKSNVVVRAKRGYYR